MGVAFIWAAADHKSTRHRRFRRLAEYEYDGAMQTILVQWLLLYMVCQRVGHHMYANIQSNAYNNSKCKHYQMFSNECTTNGRRLYDEIDVLNAYSHTHIIFGNGAYLLWCHLHTCIANNIINVNVLHFFGKSHTFIQIYLCMHLPNCQHLFGRRLANGMAGGMNANVSGKFACYTNTFSCRSLSLAIPLTYQALKLFFWCLWTRTKAEQDANWETNYVSTVFVLFVDLMTNVNTITESNLVGRAFLSDLFSIFWMISFENMFVPVNF